jgi:hypothetical protein
MRFDASAGHAVPPNDVTTKRFARAWLMAWRMVTAAGLLLDATACSSFDSATGTGGGGAATDSGTGGTRADASTGGGGSGGTGGAGTGGIRVDAASEAAAESETAAASEAAADAPPFCDLDGGDASGDCCPDDPLKTLPGVCGCGVSDLDTDGDGFADCIDVCPTDPGKTTAMGVCGCGSPDVDTDGDNTLDCLDGCPQDRTRLVPGPCGCGVPDTTPLCLAHRYSFDDGFAPDAGAGEGGRPEGGGSGEAGIGGTTVVVDSVNHADATAIGVVLTGTGSVHLAGGTSNQHIMLPAGIISALGDNATFEAWVTWDGIGGVWQRIFDFGSSDTGPGNQGVGQTWVFLSPASGPGFLLASMLTPGAAANEAPGPGLLSPGSMQHVAVVLDAASGDAAAATMSLYLNGSLQNRVAMTGRLSRVRDVNNWLGKSQFVPDPEFAGTYHEFRIYSAARTPAQVLASFQRGPGDLPAQ